MNLARFSVKNSLFVNLLSVFIIVAGIVTLTQMSREAFPNVSFDVVRITTIYRGSTPREVEKLITTPIEKELKEVDGIDEVTSSSRENISSIVVRIDPGTDDKDRVITDIQRAVDSITDLPKDSVRPKVVEIRSKNIPMLKLALSGDMTEVELQQYADSLEDEMLELPGVAKVIKVGYRDKEIWVVVAPDKLEEYYVSIEEIMDALAGRNIAISGGKIRTSEGEFSIRTTGEFFTIKEIEDIIIRTNNAGISLRVKDVAQVVDAFEDEDIIYKARGKRSIVLTILKKEKADAIRMKDRVDEKIKQIKAASGGELKIDLIYDLSYYIKRRLNVLRTNGIIGFVLVLCSLYLFLNPSTATMTALGIPIAFLATFCIMSFMGLTINLISMFGLIIMVGLIVDDGIIISENTYRYIEAGTPPREAAVKGTTEVMLPVLSTILTTIAAFSPLMFMTGMIGKFVKAIPQVVIIALAASLLEAFIILPSHLADFVKPKLETKSHKRKMRWLNWMCSKYSDVLTKILNRKYLSVTIATFIMVLFFFIGSRFIPLVMWSARGVEQFQIRAESSGGTPLKVTAKMLEPVEELVSNIPEKELDAYTASVGSIGEERGHDPHAKYGSNYAQIEVYLTPLQKRKRDSYQIADSLRPSLKKLEKELGFEKLYLHMFKEGPPTGKAIAVNVRGEDFGTLEEIKENLKEFLRSLKGVSDIADSYKVDKLEARIEIDKDKAREAGLTVNRIASSIRNAFEGGLATKIRLPKAEEEIEVRVRFPEEERNTFDAFNKLLIPNIAGKLIPLNRVAEIKEVKSLSQIRHLDGERIIKVTGGVDNKNITSFKANTLIAKKFKDISKEYLGYNLRFGGEHEENVKSLKSLFMAIMLAFFMIYVILATQFRSLVQPFIVMLAIPFGVIGVIIAFLLHGVSWSFLAIMGIIGLVGIVVNDSIVLMDFINKARLKGVDRRTAVLNACRVRFRPVILTTITTAFGLMPTAYGIGGFDPFLRPMALAISWGLIIGSVWTLLMLPCCYIILDEITLKITHHTSLIKASIQKSNNSSKN